MATRLPDSGQDELTVFFNVIILDVGAWLGANRTTWIDTEPHRQLDLGIVWGVEVAHIRVRPLKFWPERPDISDPMKQHGAKGASQGGSPIANLLKTVSQGAGCAFDIVNCVHLQQWLRSEKNAQDFAATGFAIGDAVVFVGDTHFGLRDPRTDDSYSNDEQGPMICVEPGSCVGEGFDNLTLLVQVLKAFRDAGIVNIVQLGDFFELWESEYFLFSEQHPSKEWYEYYLRQGPLGYHANAETEIRRRWGPQLDALDALFSARLRGNHDWETAGRGGVEKNTSIRLGYKTRIHAEHGHRFDCINWYGEFELGAPNWPLEFGISHLDDLKEAEPAPRGKRATWMHAEKERRNPNNEYTGRSSLGMYFNVMDIRDKMRMWIRSYSDKNWAETVERGPRVYVIGHTHQPGIERLGVGFIPNGADLVCGPSKSDPVTRIYK